MPVGETASFEVEVTNSGSASVQLDAAVDGPFELGNPEVDVAGGATVPLSVRYTPSGYDAATGTLTLSWDAGASTAVLPVTATTAADSDGDGQTATALGGTDCDDQDAAIYAGAPDTCYDHVDQDCDGAGLATDPDDEDCDQDGAIALSVGGDDCDDGDATVHPGATDVSGDGVDQDCDGLKDEDALSAGILVFSEIKTGDGGWLEVCDVGAAAVPVDNFTLTSAAGSVTLGSATVDAGACIAICSHLNNDCALEAAVAVDAASDDVRLLAGSLELDRVTIQSGWSWWDDADVWSVDPGSLTAAGNDVSTAWCDTHGSPGELNPACP